MSRIQKVKKRNCASRLQVFPAGTLALIFLSCLSVIEAQQGRGAPPPSPLLRLGMPSPDQNDLIPSGPIPRQIPTNSGPNPIAGPPASGPPAPGPPAPGSLPLGLPPSGPPPSGPPAPGPPDGQNQNGVSPQILLFIERQVRNQLQSLSLPQAPDQRPMGGDSLAQIQMLIEDQVRSQLQAVIQNGPPNALQILSQNLNAIQARSGRR